LAEEAEATQHSEESLSGPSQEDLDAKREFIAAFFEDFEDRVAFLVSLHEEGHEDEAWLLCLVYIDGLANWLNLPETKSAQNFSRVLMKHGGHDAYSIVLPKWLMKAVPWGSAPNGLELALGTAISTLPATEVFLATEFLKRVQPHLSPEHLGWLEREILAGFNRPRCVLRSPVTGSPLRGSEPRTQLLRKHVPGSADSASGLSEPPPGTSLVDGSRQESLRRDRRLVRRSMSWSAA